MANPNLSFQNARKRADQGHRAMTQVFNALLRAHQEGGISRVVQEAEEMFSARTGTRQQRVVEAMSEFGIWLASEGEDFSEVRSAYYRMGGPRYILEQGGPDQFERAAT